MDLEAADARQLEHFFDSMLSQLIAPAALLAGARTDTPAELDARALAGFGLHSVNLPAESGGLSLPRPTLAGIFEVAGRRLLPQAWREEAVVLAPLLAATAAAGDGAATGWLEALRSGRLRGGGGVLLGADGGAASWDGSGVHLERFSVWLPARAALAHVTTPGWSALIDLTDPALSIDPVHSVDPGQGVTALSGEVRVPSSRVITGRFARDMLRDWQLAVFAQLLGSGGEMLGRARAYALERRQFGRQIAQHQAVAHRLADMAAAVETLRSSVSRLAWAAQDGQPDDGLGASLRYWAPMAMREVCESAIQVHGGIGFTWEAGLHLHYRRVLQLQAALGGASATARDLGRALLTPSAGEA